VVEPSLRRARWPALVAALGACSGGAAPAAMEMVDAGTGGARDGAGAEGRDASLAIDAGDTAGPAIDAGGLSAAAFIASYCSLLAPCCGLVNLPTDGARCRALIGELAAAPFRASTAEACLAVLRGAGPAGPAALCGDGFVAVAPTCDRVFTDVVASKHLGEPCGSNAECLLTRANVTCAMATSGTGRCQSKEPGIEGASPCGGTVNGKLTVPVSVTADAPAKVYLCDVANDLWCDEDSHACVKSKALGEPCAHFGECGPRAACDDTSGKCAPRVPAGSACDVDEICQTVYCREDNICSDPPPIDGALARLCGG
jgi:hypothetical protein